MSLQRRMEHFIIICMIKVRVDEVPNDLEIEFHLFQFQFCRRCREGVAVAFKCNMTRSRVICAYWFKALECFADGDI